MQADVVGEEPKGARRTEWRCLLAQGAVPHGAARRWTTTALADGFGRGKPSRPTVSKSMKTRRFAPVTEPRPTATGEPAGPRNPEMTVREGTPPASRRRLGSGQVEPELAVDVRDEARRRARRDLRAHGGRGTADRHAYDDRATSGG